MAINSYFDNTDINIYFHMKNHYRKLRSARSTIDNSFPQSFVKTYTPPNSGRYSNRTIFEERCNSNDQHLNSCSAIVRKHNCISSASGTSETSVKTVNIPPRPKTRRNCFRSPSNTQYYPRSQSAGPNYKKDTCVRTSKAKKKRHVTETKDVVEDVNLEPNSKLDLTDQCEYDKYEQNLTNRSILSSKDSLDKAGSSSRIEEHEYLQFVLRITEDIIINNLYKNEDIERVFQTHIEANKDHLKVDKMEAQLAILCAELKIPYKSNETNEKHYDRFLDYNIYNSDYEQNLQDCECTTKRSLIMENQVSVFEPGKKEREMESEFKRMFNLVANKCSLGRVTECTETTNSLDALIEQIKQISVTSVLGSEYDDMMDLDMKTDTTNSTELLAIRNEESSIIEKKSCDPDLTEKEKLSDMEEEILYRKCNSNKVDGDELENIHLDKIKNFRNENINSSGNESAIMAWTTTNILETYVVNVTDQEKSESVVNIPDNVANRLIENLRVPSLKNIKETSAYEEFNKHFDIPDNNIKKSIENLNVSKNHETNEEEKFDSKSDVSYSDSTFKNRIENDLENKLDIPMTVSSNDIKKLLEDLSVPCLKIINSNMTKEISKSGSELEDLNATNFINEEKGFLKAFNTENFEIMQQNDSEMPYILKTHKSQDYSMKEKILQDFIQGNKKVYAELPEEKTRQCTSDQYTQVEIEHRDKECNTSILLNEYMTKDYVLLNGPIYVLKSILNSEDKLIIYDKDNIRNNLQAEATSTRLCDDNATSLQHYHSIPALQSQTRSSKAPSHFNDDFSKLLNSDYDLMPQRDSNTLNNNYHHLSVDAATDISNTNLEQTVNNMFINPDALLLTNKYELFSPTQEIVIPATDNIKIKEGTGLPTSNQNELEKYALSKQENNSTMNSSYSTNDKAQVVFHEQLSGLDVSLTNNNLFSNNFIKGTNASRDVSESGEIVRASICTDDEISHELTSRSDTERNSNSFPPNRSNILGKRKLEHPS